MCTTDKRKEYNITKHGWGGCWQRPFGEGDI